MSGIEKRVNICVSKIRQRVAGVAREKVEGLSDRIVAIETQSRRSRLAESNRLRRCRFSRIVRMRSQMPGPREKLCDRAGWKCRQVAGVRRRYSKSDCNDEQRVESYKFGGPFGEDARN